MIEVYACEWQDESFRSGWSVADPLYHVFNTDGDVATISCSVEVSQAKAEKALPGVSTDVARFLAVKVTEFSGDGWGVKVRDSSGAWHDITGVQTATGYAEFGLPEGLTLDRIAIISYSSGSLARFDWLGLLRKPRLLLKAKALRVVRRINACSEFEVECLEPWAADASVFNDVKIIIGGRKVFCGLVLARELQKMGRAVTRVRLRGADYAWHLANREAKKRKYSGQAHEVIEELIKPLVDEGLLTAENVEHCSEHVELDLSDESISILEALKRVCGAEHVGFDFYVDCGADLHAFTRGSQEQTDLALEPLSYRIRQEASEIINSVTVLGATSKVEPADGDYTHHMELWSCLSGNALLAQDDDVFFLTAPSLRVEQMGNEDVIVRLTLPSPLDLRPEPGSSKRKELRFYAKWEGTYDPKLVIQLHDNEKGYFEHADCLSGVPYGFWGVLDMGRIRAVRLSLYEKEPREWDAISRLSSPSWSHITHIDFIINVGDGGRLWLDELHVANFRYKGHAQDDESIRAYGLKHITLIDDNITSDEEAQARAEAIVASKSQPDIRIEDITALGVTELEPGSKIHISVPETSGDYIVNELEHVITPYEGFTTRMSCSRTGDPSPGWGAVLSGQLRTRLTATSVAREVREEEKPVAPQSRLPASFVIANPSKLLSDFLTADGGKLKLEELERWPFTGEDLAQNIINHGHLKPELDAAVGRYYEAEGHGGTTGQEVTDDTASGGKARKASSTDPGGSLVEVM
ncbi:MAG: hypothetical protein DRN06_08555 [Thermoprotei archaeon]|nr:MAG: hypothetical protein DRN06_08555 [Thermoprotei archaeon]